MSKFLVCSFLALVLFLGLAGFEYVQFHDGKLHIIFCDVGQGDAILIKTPDNRYVLVDGGPDRRVLDCLSRHMPFWERKIDIMLLTHPHADHFMGMFHVLDRYSVGTFVTEDLINKTAAYRELLSFIDEKQIAQKRVLAGDSWQIGEMDFTIAGPTRKYLEQTSPGGTIGESAEFASVITQVSYGNFTTLLTGDSQAMGLRKSMEFVSGDVTVLQSPHHGSWTGLDKELLSQIQPHLGVISVGAENRYGHPHPQLLNLFTSSGIPSLRTDLKGDIEIVSDGNEWRVLD